MKICRVEYQVLKIVVNELLFGQIISLGKFLILLLKAYFVDHLLIVNIKTNKIQPKEPAQNLFSI